MSKFISRISLKKQAHCILLQDFQLFAPGSSKEYELVNLELVRGKARKVLQASVSAPGGTGL